MIFSFTAIVGQEDMKFGLILNVIDPTIGGLLIAGEKGTGKSTAVRALAELLPEMEVVKGCRFNCDPSSDGLCTDCQERIEQGEALDTERKKMRVVELPLGATEDRVVGTLDVEHAIKHGEKRFEPGILADANRNFLYVDEVNLLEDHIVDLLLDAAAMGVNYVEREGVSFVHPARFILVGTMNPEEGELRPQLLDRFGLSVKVQSIKEKALRAEILKRREEFDLDPEGFSKRWQPQQEELSRRIMEAKGRLSAIRVPDEVLERIVTLTSQLNVDGHRADIVILKAARALSAFGGKEEVEVEEVQDAARLSLGHRLKRLPFEEIGAEREKMEELLSKL